MVPFAIIMVVIGWSMCQITTHLGNLAHSPLWNRPPIFRNKFNIMFIDFLSMLSLLIFIIGSLLLYVFVIPFPIFWWIIIIISASMVGEILNVLLFYKETIVSVCLTTSILSPLIAIILILPFWLISQFYISWVYKILIMIPCYFIYLRLIMPTLSTLVTLLSIPITFLLFPLIWVEKKLRGWNEQKSIRLKPNYAEIHYNQGLAYATSGDYQKAIAAYKETIRLKPDDADAHCNLGNVYSRLGDYQKATESLEETIRLKPDDAEAHYLLCIAYIGMGNRENALNEYNVLRVLDKGLSSNLLNIIFHGEKKE